MENVLIYTLFGLAAVAALLAFIGYRLGLQTATRHLQTRHDLAARALGDQITARDLELIEVKRQRDSRDTEIRTLHRNLSEHARLREGIERNLLARLASAAPLTRDDLETLKEMVHSLELAGETWAHFPQLADSTRQVRQLALQALNMAQRYKAAAEAPPRPHPDSELVDWLQANATSTTPEVGTEQLTFSLVTYSPPYSDLREALRAAMDQHARLETSREMAEHFSTKPAPSLWAAIDQEQAERGLGQPMCL